MNWFKAMNHALSYIEDHIEDDLKSEDIAAIALCSKHHFLRTFTMLTGISLGEYIRQRRLSLAAKDLISTHHKIIDIAYKYGYETPEAFCKAFKKLHGMAPSQARKHSLSLKAIPPLSFQITIKGETRMDYKIIEKDAFQLVGLTRNVTTEHEQNYQIVPAFWQEICKKGITKKMEAQSDTKYAVCYNYDAEIKEFKYMVGIEGTHINDVEGTEVLEIPKSTWAIFESVGPMPHAIQKVWKRIYSEWFPATKYEHASTPELEVYLPGDATSDDYRCQVWIPIVEKK
ncbi:AraC family transcriptional regulator [Vallitalea pronyensis]|uniref:AraC family transcriptional regulator n=1 Tax=Vallitalea pronyensis TaxID=1348613 RepID=A0A8J8MIR7_9FIRM|nr:AraC family transcriptional regulator [Vallitalea pronyensis]QUI22410.1 AraC family transcriptional regulator [Vallitalea pronyensis]